MDTINHPFLLAITMGLLANLHCIGMCGPIALALPLNRKSSFTISSGILFYTLGRSLGYALLGLLVGFIGFSANLAGVLQILSIVSGGLILLFAWKGYYNKAPKLRFLNNWISKSMGAIFKNKSEKGRNKRLGSFGFVNAFLPCGMVYIALLSAMNSGSIKNAAIFMILFGLGTLPGFLGIAFLKNHLFKFKFVNNKIIVASLVSIIGVAIILRGLNLDIPYISPKMEFVQSTDNSHNKEEAVLSCCSKKETCSTEEE